MSRQIYAVCLKCLFSLLLLLSIGLAALGQSASSAAVNGVVQDTTDARIPNANVKLINTDTGTESNSKTSKDGGFVIPSVLPGHYRLQIERDGFDTTQLTGITLNVGDNKNVIIRMKVGSSQQTVTVDGSGLTLNTTDGSVSTVVDRNFAENLPMNGRSFQTLIELTPGVVTTASTGYDAGQFSVNGQRATANYFTVDGVSANIGITQTGAGGDGLGGSLGSFSVLGGTNSLVSVDALEEFRIQTSTFAPEFGRTPGGQISLVTRSGTNAFHGTVFDYLRNDVFDANNWFNGYTNDPPLPKARERQNDFGGVFSGPIIEDSTFFFFSYEGLRLRLPQTSETTVPDLSARQSAAASLQSYLNAYPQPNGPELGDGSAAFNASYSNPATLDAYSLRLDHKFGRGWTIFGRYSYSPSQLSERGAESYALSVVQPFRVTTQTATAGATWTASNITNDLRFNYSRTNGSSYSYIDGFGGAAPPASLPFPNSLTTKNASFGFGIFSLEDYLLGDGKNGTNIQRQINVVDTLALQKGTHSLKFGVDYRRLTPIYSPFLYEQGAYFDNIQNAQTGSIDYGLTESNIGATFLFRNLGLFAQDTWRISPRLTMTYGLRWDIDFVPQSLNGPSIPAVTGYDLNNLSSLALAPAGTSPYQTTYDDIAPRIGAAYQIHLSQNWETVARGGFGVFYDLASQEVGNNLADYYPFGAAKYQFGGTFPFSATDAAPPSITPSAGFASFDPHLTLPYTYEWNIAIEQSLGLRQSISATYLGASGRRLLQTAAVSSPNPNISTVLLIANAGTSDYNALQLQFQRRLTHGLQMLASYSWSHSLDDGSAGSIGTVSNALVPAAFAGSNRGPSDFDVRNSFSTGITYAVPGPKSKHLWTYPLQGWSTENFIIARSAPPVSVNGYEYNGTFVDSIAGYFVYLRPSVVQGQPFYLYSSTYPGGKALNPAAFAAPPYDPSTMTFSQGDLGRNALRGFGATQWDFAIHKDFAMPESVKLQFRAEMFNLLNHPNFGPPDGNLNDPTFGRSTAILAQSLSSGNVGGGGLSSLYQLGGPRSIQVALKLSF